MIYFLYNILLPIYSINIYRYGELNYLENIHSGMGPNKTFNVWTDSESK